MPAAETASGIDRPVPPPTRRRILMAWRIVFVRLRFFLVLGAALAVVSNWDWLCTHWQKVTHQVRGAAPVEQAESADTEYWCPMCPGVVSDGPAKCPVCNMGLVRRQRGETVPSADGGLPRMQLTPYRVQLAGIQTAVAAYRPLAYEVVTGGFIRSHPPGDQHAPAGAAEPARVWVQAEVYEKDLALLAEGQRVQIACEGFPERTPRTGQVRKVMAPSVPDRPSPRVLVAIDSPPSELRPGMFVMVRVQVPPHRLEWLTRGLADDWRDRTTTELVGKALAKPAGVVPAVGLEPLLETACRRALLQRELVLTVLDSAIIDTGSKQVVYRETGPGMFEAVEVVVGPRCGEFRPVLHGLAAGQRVAAAGAFLLDAETRLNPAVAAAYFGAARTLAPARPGPPDIARALARLVPADRAMAARQKTCPVTGQPLGSMGTPVRLEVAGKIVFLCCQGCESELRANAHKYLSKLP